MAGVTKVEIAESVEELHELLRKQKTVLLLRQYLEAPPVRRSIPNCSRIIMI